MAKSPWKTAHYVEAYKLARSGMSDKQIAGALGITVVTLRKWKDGKDGFAKAINDGREEANGESGAAASFQNYVYENLPPAIQVTWDRIFEAQLEENGVRKVEKLLRDKGKRTRQMLFLHAVIVSNFNVSQACRLVQTPRKTFETWATTDPDFSALVDGIMEVKRDFFESALVKLVKRGDSPAIIFANKTFNRERGYGEKTTVDVNVAGSVKHLHAHVAVDELELSLDVRKQLLKAVRKRKAIEANGSAKNEPPRLLEHIA